MINLMEIAKAVAKNSKDPSSKVGAVIVDERRRILSTGYNGFIAGCDEGHMTYERPMKYLTIVHAEMNALLFSHRPRLDGCIMVTTHGPCESCLKHVLQAGIRKIYYEDASIIRDRGTPEQKEAIARLINSTRAVVMNYFTMQHYLEEIK